MSTYTIDTEGSTNQQEVDQFMSGLTPLLSKWGATVDQSDT